MILSAFDVTFDENKDEIPPRARRPPKKLETKNVQEVSLQKVKKQTMCKKNDPKKSNRFYS